MNLYLIANLILAMVRKSVPNITHGCTANADGSWVIGSSSVGEYHHGEWELDGETLIVHIDGASNRLAGFSWQNLETTTRVVSAEMRILEELSELQMETHACYDGGGYFMSFDRLPNRRSMYNTCNYSYIPSRDEAEADVIEHEMRNRAQQAMDDYWAEKVCQEGINLPEA